MADPLIPRLHAALMSAPVGIALFDADDRLRFATPWFEAAYGVCAADGPSWEDMMRRCHATRRGVLIETADIDAWIRQVRQRYRQQPVRSFQSDLVDGRWVWVTERLQADGWLSMVISDVSPLKTIESALRAARDEAQQIAMTDPLTELSNRRFIMKHLENMLDSAAAMRLPLTLVMLDIDHFKRINDSAGHDVGDAVLRDFARRMQAEVRPMDAVGRIGGEEFLLVLANSDIDGASRMIGRVRSVIAEATRCDAPALPEYTFSAGIALASEGDSVDSLYRRADQALMQAKKDGRNRDWAVNSRSMRI